MKHVLVALVAVFLAACPPVASQFDAGGQVVVSDAGWSDAGEDDAGASDSGVDAGDDYEVTRLDAGVLDGGGPVAYELLRIHMHGHTAYAQWMPAR